MSPLINKKTIRLFGIVMEETNPFTSTDEKVKEPKTPTEEPSKEEKQEKTEKPEEGGGGDKSEPKEDKTETEKKPEEGPKEDKDGSPTEEPSTEGSETDPPEETEEDEDEDPDLTTPDVSALNVSKVETGDKEKKAAGDISGEKKTAPPNQPNELMRYVQTGIRGARALLFSN